MRPMLRPALTVLAFVACLAVLIKVAGSACQSPSSPMEVADPRPAHHVVDVTGTLDAPELEAIDAAAAAASVNGELLVVVVASTGNVAPRQWATMLFNRLRLDSKERNRGVLLLAAIKDRKSEIVVGEGYPDHVTAITDDIMQSVVVTHFKSGDAKRALVEGARAIAGRVIAPPPPLLPVAKLAPPLSPELLAATAAAAAHPRVTAMVDPRPNSAVIDEAKALSTSDVHELDSLVQFQIGAGIEPLFVAVKDTGGVPSRAFAQALLDRLLATPAAGAQRGLLVLAATGDGTLDVVTGAGIPTWLLPSVDALTAEAAALMKSDGAGAALRKAARAISYLGMELDMKGAMMAQAERAHADAAAAAVQSAPFVPYAPPRTAMDAFDIDPDNPLVFVAGAGALAGSGLGVREVLRRRPRSCGKCDVRMHRLSEELDDQHLQPGEVAEERLRSVDYDVWACGTCGSVLKTRWGAIFSSYSRCTSCSCKTMKSTSRTITSASTSSTGLAEVTETCSHCPHHRTFTRVIPRVQRSSSSGGSSSGGGYSSGRGSSGSW